MSENIQEGTNPEVVEIQEGSNVETPEVLTTEMEAIIEARVNEAKVMASKEISGLNRKVSELQTVVKEKEREGKTEEEQKNLLLEEKKEIQEEIKNLNRGRMVDKALDSAGLPLEFAKRIIGKTEEDITEDVKVFNEYVEQLAQQRAEKIINERLGGEKLKGGESPTEKAMDRETYNALDPISQGEFIRQGGVVN